MKIIVKREVERRDVQADHHHDDDTVFCMYE